MCCFLIGIVMVASRSRNKNKIKVMRPHGPLTGFQKVLANLQRSENNTAMWYIDIIAGLGDLCYRKFEGPCLLLGVFEKRICLISNTGCSPSFSAHPDCLSVAQNGSLQSMYTDWAIKVFPSWENLSKYFDKIQQNWSLTDVKHIFYF